MLSEDAVSPQPIRFWIVRLYSAEFSDRLDTQSWYCAGDCKDIASVRLPATEHLRVWEKVSGLGMCPWHLVLHHRTVGPLVPVLGPLVHPEDLRLPVPGQAEHTCHHPLIPVIQKLALNS